jgi:hypothetical protein
MIATGFASAQTLPQPVLPRITSPAASAPLNASAAAKIPAWVRAGLDVTYIAYSAFVENGKYVDPIELTVSSLVTSSSASIASGKTTTHTIGTPLTSTYNWTCTNLGQCRGGDWQFWVDPNDPTASIRGPEGERFTIAGSGRYTDPWKRTWNATLLNYQNNSSGVRFTVCFDRSSGLILYNVESYPTEYVLEFYYS